MATTYNFKIHGPSAEPMQIAIDAEDDSKPESWLEQFAENMRQGEVRDLPFGRGECRIDFSKVWAVTYQPPGRVMSF